MLDYAQYCTQLNECLKKLEADLKGKKIAVQEAFEWLTKESESIRKNNRYIFFVGNGASASMASHMALDMWKNLQIRSMAFNDLVSLTATSNDFSYEDVFSKPLEFFAHSGDALVCISSSGNSPNVVRAAQQAKTKGVHVITLSAMKSNNKLRQLGDLNFYVPGDTYGFAETAHQTLLHFWVDCLLSRQKK